MAFVSDGYRNQIILRPALYLGRRDMNLPAVVFARHYSVVLDHERLQRGNILLPGDRNIRHQVLILRLRVRPRPVTAIGCGVCVRSRRNRGQHHARRLPVFLLGFEFGVRQHLQRDAIIADDLLDRDIRHEKVHRLLGRILDIQNVNRPRVCLDLPRRRTNADHRIFRARKDVLMTVAKNELLVFALRRQPHSLRRNTAAQSQRARKRNKTQIHRDVPQSQKCYRAD